MVIFSTLRQLNASLAKRLSTSPRKVLEALHVLHEDGYVHTDIKLDNVLVNYGQGNTRFADVQLVDCGNTVRVDSSFTKDGDIIGAPVWRSPEAQLQIGWSTPTDIWSLSTMLISLIYGENWFIFKPDVPADHEEYELKILMKQHQFFGPFPLSYGEIADPETFSILTHILHRVPQEKVTHFRRISEREVSKEDKAFILKIMKLDPRDRPTARELLQDEWFTVA